MKRIKSSTEIIAGLSANSQKLLSRLSATPDKFLHQHERDNRYCELWEPGDHEPISWIQKFFESNTIAGIIYQILIVVIIAIIVWTALTFTIF